MPTDFSALTLSAFEVSVVDTTWTHVVNEFTSGRAKRAYHRLVSQAWPVHYTAMRARKLGPPISSIEFLRCATSRGLPDARCGDRVRVDNGHTGVIVGHNASANFDVLFFDGPCRGQALNVHPSGLTVIRS